MADSSLPQLDVPYIAGGLTLYKPIGPEEWAKADIVRKLRTDRFNCNLELQAEAADEIEKLRSVLRTAHSEKIGRPCVCIYCEDKHARA